MASFLSFPPSLATRSSPSQGNFVLELRALWIGIEIEIAIEIGTLAEIDFDHDFDFDFDFNELCPTLGVPCEKPSIERSEIMKIFQRTKWPCSPTFGRGL
jgi:hypothetical protein